MTNDTRANGAEAQLTGFFGKYAPPIAKLGQALRKKLRARLPGLSEVVYVYERQESLVISYSPTDQGYAAVCSLALYPQSVRLYFAHGPQLQKSDPHRLLQGRAGTVRYVELAAAGDLDRPEIEGFVAAALTLSKVRVDPSAQGALILKAAEQKRRAERATQKTSATPKASTIENAPAAKKIGTAKTGTAKTGHVPKKTPTSSKARTNPKATTTARKTKSKA